MNSRISEGKDYLRNSFIVFLAVLVCIFSLRSVVRADAGPKASIDIRISFTALPQTL